MKQFVGKTISHAEAVDESRIIIAFTNGQIFGLAANKVQGVPQIDVTELGAAKPKKAPAAKRKRRA